MKKEIPPSTKEKILEICRQRKQLRFLFAYRLFSFLLVIQQGLDLMSLNVTSSSLFLPKVRFEEFGFLSCCSLHNSTLIFSGMKLEMIRDVQPAMNFFLVMILLKFAQWVNNIISDNLAFLSTKHILHKKNETVMWDTIPEPYQTRRYDVCFLTICNLCFTMCILSLPAIIYYLHSQGNGNKFDRNPWNSLCDQEDENDTLFIPTFADAMECMECRTANCVFPLPRTWYRLQGVLCVRVNETVAGSFETYEEVMNIQRLLWNKTLFALGISVAGLGTSIANIVLT